MRRYVNGVTRNRPATTLRAAAIWSLRAGGAARRPVPLALLIALAATALPTASAPSAQRPDPATVASSPAGAASPPILQNLSLEPNTVEVKITAAPTTLRLGPSDATPVYAYNGQVPGPTLEAREGDRVIVHF